MAYRTSTDAVTADAASNAVEVKGGNEHSPMYAFIEYWSAAVGSSTGTAKFSIRSKATSGATGDALVSDVQFTVDLTTTAKTGRMYLPVCTPDPFTEVYLDLTGTGATIKYNAFLVPSRAGA